MRPERLKMRVHGQLVSIRRDETVHGIQYLLHLKELNRTYKFRGPTIERYIAEGHLYIGQFVEFDIDNENNITSPIVTFYIPAVPMACVIEKPQSRDIWDDL